MAAISDQAVTKATGRDWADWRRHLDAAGAGALAHQRISQMLHTQGLSGWWSQMVTVEYERMIGRRQALQKCDGSFSANASRTLPGNMGQAMTAWCALVDGMTQFDEVSASALPRLTRSEKWRYWRVALADGSQVTVMAGDKVGGKAALAVNHDKLDDAIAAARWKAWWKAMLGRL